MKNTKLIWGSPHKPSSQQISSLEEEYNTKLEYLQETNPELYEKMTNSPQTREGLWELAVEVCVKMHDNVLVQPAGSLAFQSMLGSQRAWRGGSWHEGEDKRPKQIVYAHSERVSEDHVQPDGSVKKISIFKHINWIKL